MRGNFHAGVNTTWYSVLFDHKLTKLFSIENFPDAKHAGKVLIIIIILLLIIIIIIIIICIPLHQVYCDMTSSGQGWTLIACFSNKDNTNWMDNARNWWYDRNTAYGRATDPSYNIDMVSPAFWLVSGNELKITRSADAQHTALLHITSDCLGGLSFRSKIVSYGNFRNSVVWA